jgi:hypothetical protein
LVQAKQHQCEQNPVLRWQAETGHASSISYSRRFVNYISIVKGFPFGWATIPLTYADLPVFSGDT